MNIEEQIRRAMEEGQFDDLPGKGKPLKLDENAFDDPEWRLANKVLKDAGFSLPWIERRQEIESGLETARGALKRAWAWRLESLETKQPTRFVEDEWQRAEKLFRQQIEELNKRIFLYNLEVPSPRFQRPTLNGEREIETIVQGQAGSQ
jgi:DnaJ family protein C protein 28